MAYQTGALQADDKNVTDSYDTRTAADCCAYLLPHLRPHHDILDVGCGPGSITAGLAALCPEGRTLGVDVSEGVVAQARRLYASEEGRGNLSFDICDAADLSRFEDASFDIVHAHMCIVHLQNPAKALAEFYRVCKPGGIIATRDPAPDMQALSLRFKPDVPGLREVMTTLRIFIRQQTGITVDVAATKAQWLREAGAIDGDRIVEAQSTIIQRSMGAGLERVGPVIVRGGLCTAAQMEGYVAAMAEWAAAPEREMVLPCWDCLCFKT